MTVRYCSACGSSVESGDAFCTQCGQQLPDQQAERAGTERRRNGTAGRRGSSTDGWGSSTGGLGEIASGLSDIASGWGDTSRSRSKTEPSRGEARTGGTARARRQQLAARVDRLRGAGWRVQQDDGNRVVMVDRDVGSLPAHVLLFLLTGGTGNVLYGAYRWTIGAPRRELRTDGTDRRLSAGRAINTIGLGVIAGLVLFIGVVVSLGSLLAGQPSGVLAFLAALSASYLLAQAAGLGGDGLDLSRFGRERTVDTEPAQVAAEPCASCGGPVQAGERRQYADQTYVAGVSVWTHRSGENVYCQQCLNDEHDADRVGSGFDLESERA